MQHLYPHIYVDGKPTRWIEPEGLTSSITAADGGMKLTVNCQALPNTGGVTSSITNTCTELTKDQYKQLTALHGKQNHKIYNCGIDHSLLRGDALRTDTDGDTDGLGRENCSSGPGAPMHILAPDVEEKYLHRIIFYAGKYRIVNFENFH